MSDFQFLRSKWPKLAAVAADASRMLEVSPSSAISSMKTFVDWSADKLLDLYDIKPVPNATLVEKLEVLKASGQISQDMLAKFHAIRAAQTHGIYRNADDLKLAQRCYHDMYEIARWMVAESDRGGSWPARSAPMRPQPTVQSEPGDGSLHEQPAMRSAPAAPSYRSSGYASGGGSDGYASGGSGYNGGGFAAFWDAYGRLVLIGVAALVIVVLLVMGINALIQRDNNPVIPVDTPTANIGGTEGLLGTPSPEPSPTPPAEVEAFLDDGTINISRTFDSLHLGKWRTTDGDITFHIDGQEYANGLGMFVPSRRIEQETGSLQSDYDLGGQYSLLRFDIGADSEWDYGEGHGNWRVVMYADAGGDENILYDSDWQAFDYVAKDIEVDLRNCNTLKILLRAYKGDNGTTNVVLGNIRAVKGAASPSQPLGTDATSAPPTDDTSTPPTDGTSAPPTGDD